MIVVKEVNYYQREVTVEEFIEIRKAVDWNIPPKEAVKAGLENTFFSICAERNGELVGYGRVVGDGGLVFYVQDVIVKPTYQGAGIGTEIMKRIMRFPRQSYRKGTTVCLMSAKRREDFYSQ